MATRRRITWAYRAAPLSLRVGPRGIPTAWKGIIIHLTFISELRGGKSNPDVGQWEGTGSRLLLYHQYGQKVDAVQLRSCGNVTAVSC